MTKQIWVITLLLSVIVSLAAAKTVYVDSNGPNDPGSGTADDPFRRIQTGIDAAGNGEISPGVYTGTGNYNLDPASKASKSGNIADLKFGRQSEFSLT